MKKRLPLKPLKGHESIAALLMSDAQRMELDRRRIVISSLDGPYLAPSIDKTLPIPPNAGDNVKRI